MSKVLELREKRAKVWDEAKRFLDEKRGESGILSAEDTEVYEKMEAEVVALGKEVERLERQDALDRELSKPTAEVIRNTPKKNDEEKDDRSSKAYRLAFWNAMRSKGSFGVENALRIGQDAEGGYLVPDEFETTLIAALNDANIMRTLAKVITTSYGDRQIPVVSSKGTATWIEEGGAFTESDDTFGQVILGAHKLGTIIKVSEELLNDSVFNLESYIATEFARRIGAAEEEAFIKGNGTNKPTGLLASAEVGVTSLVEDAITFDEVIDLWHSLREPYRKDATWLMNDSTAKAIRKLKDDNGQYIWTPSVQAGMPDKILNNPVKTSTFMPEIAAGEKALAFGDYSYYWIADRQGRSFQRLSELYAATGQVGFRAYQRVDGKLILPETIKILQMKAS